MAIMSYRILKTKQQCIKRTFTVIKTNKYYLSTLIIILKKSISSKMVA